MVVCQLLDVLAGYIAPEGTQQLRRERMGAGGVPRGVACLSLLRRRTRLAGRPDFHLLEAGHLARLRLVDCGGNGLCGPVLR